MSNPNSENNVNSGENQQSIITAVIVICSVLFVLCLYFVCSRRKDRWKTFKKWITCQNLKTQPDLQRELQTLEARIEKYEADIKRLNEDKKSYLEERAKLTNLANQVLSEGISSIKIDIKEGDETKEMVLKEIQAMKEKLTDYERVRICTVCYERPRDVVFLECGHLVCCDECATNVRECPFDKSVILKKKRIFVA